MAFFVTELEKSNILQVLYKYRDATTVERDENKAKMDYHNKLMDLMLNHFEDGYPMEWNEIFNNIQNKYHQHRGKYEELSLTLTSLEQNIQILLCYTKMID